MTLSLNSIHAGDCLELLGQLPPASVHLAFADPPFNIGYDYDQYDDNRQTGDYLDWTRQWMQAVDRVLCPNGTFWLAIGDEYAAELKLIAQNEVGLTCRSWVIWYYTFGVNCRRGFSRSHTHLFHFVKDPENYTFNVDNPAVRVPSARQLVYADGRANPRGRLPDNTWILRPQDLPHGFDDDEDVWYFARVAGTFKEREGFHGCQMPEQLLGRIIRTCSAPNDVVLDPFAGSGTTLAVAKKLGRRWIGTELSQDYAQRIQRRINGTEPGDSLVGPPDPKLSAPSTSRGKTRRGPRKGKSGGGRSLDQQEQALAIIEAYRETHDGLSADQLLADVERNAAFIACCRQHRIAGHPAGWNKALLAIRKQGLLPRLAARGGQRLTFRDMDAYSFASEIAMQQTCVDFDTTLDGVLCDPQIAAQFDQLAAAFAPGFRPYEYRWAALSLRKRAKSARQLASTRFEEWLQCQLPRSKPLSRLDCSTLDGPGVYVLSSRARRVLYVGESLCLADRLESLGDNAAWQNWEPASVKVVAHPDDRHGLQSALVGRLRPLLNSRLLLPAADKDAHVAAVAGAAV